MKSRSLGDWAVALSVIVCSVVLLAALGMALNGTMLGKPARVVRVNFHDITGINMGARVKYAGAVAGSVAAIRMLTMAERIATGDPRNAIQVSLALNANVPPLPADIAVSIAADTLLSDKFILLSGGTPDAPPLTDDQILAGVTPTTFDELARNVNGAIVAMQDIFGDTHAETGSVFRRLREVLDEAGSLVTEARSLVSQANPVVADAGTLITEARGIAGETKALIDENREPIKRTVVRLERAAGALDDLGTKGRRLLVDNEKAIAATIGNFKVAAENLKLTSAYAVILTRSLAERPSRILWGGRPPALPSQEEILRSRAPLPAN